MENTFISAEYLKENFEDKNLVILEASFFLPNMNRNASEEFLEEHISNSQFFDIDKICDLNSKLPHMLPNASYFQQCAQNLGISSESKIIVYDRSPLLSSARAWWMFRYFGHKNVCILDGGFRKWKIIKGKTEIGEPHKFKKGNFTSQKPYKTGVISFSEMKNIIISNFNTQILDARSSDRFLGKSIEPRPGLRSGHIPGSFNLPISEIINKDDGTIKTQKELKALFLKSGINLEKEIITTCGSGVTAAGLTVALASIGKDNVRVYDGSWTEWGASKEKIKTQK